MDNRAIRGDYYTKCVYNGLRDDIRKKIRKIWIGDNEAVKKKKKNRLVILEIKTYCIWKLKKKNPPNQFPICGVNKRIDTLPKEEFVNHHLVLRPSSRPQLREVGMENVGAKIQHVSNGSLRGEARMREAYLKEIWLRYKENACPPIDTGSQAE